MQPNNPGQFDAFVNSHPIGSVVTGRVEDVRHFGAFCQLSDGVQGLLLVVDFGDPPLQFNYPDDYPRLGDTITATIALVNKTQRIIRLSRRSSGAV